MSSLSLLGYVLIITTFAINNIKKLSANLGVHLFHVVLFAYIAMSTYFTDLISSEFFVVLATLFGVSYYSIFLVKNNTNGLFINTSQFLLPLLLIVSQSFWEQLTIILLLEMVRVIADADQSETGSEQSFLSFVNASSRTMFLFIIFFIFYVQVGDLYNVGLVKIDNELVLVPLAMSFMMISVFFGGANSLSVEKINLKKYLSQNILVYSYIYQFLIPLVLIRNIKLILEYLTPSLYHEAIFVLNLMFLTCLFVILINHYRSKSLIYRFLLYKSILLLLLSYIYLVAKPFEITDRKSVV